MKVYDIFIAYVSWNNDGKMRPVLILERQEAIVYVFNITAQYENKSQAIRAKYFKINDWQQAGLEKQSYIDTNAIQDLPSAALKGKSAIGKLSAADEERLIEFINE